MEKVKQCIPTQTVVAVILAAITALVAREV